MESKKEIGWVVINHFSDTMVGDTLRATRKESINSFMEGREDNTWQDFKRHKYDCVKVEIKIVKNGK